MDGARPEERPPVNFGAPQYASVLVLSLLALGRESHLLSPAGGRIWLDFRTSVSPQEGAGHVVGADRERYLRMALEVDGEGEKHLGEKYGQIERQHSTHIGSG